MRTLVGRLRSCETGSALVEYGLIIAIVALGLIAALAGIREAVGNLTNRTSVTISRQAGGYGYGGGESRHDGGGEPMPETPSEPEPERDDADSTGVAVDEGMAASGAH